MKTRIVLVILMVLMVSGLYSQSNLNEYKYVIVLNKYDFLKSENQYNLNALTEFLFKKYGFTAIMEGETYPKDLESNGCLALRSDVKKDKGLFKTKLSVVLKNCKNQIVYTSKIGESREKNFKTGYHLALRDAFTSFESINYNFKPNFTIVSEVSINNTEIESAAQMEKLKAEIVALKKVQKKSENKPAKKDKELKKASTEKSSINESKIKEQIKELTPNLLYAQPIGKGFQIVDSTPKVIMVLLETHVSNTYVVKNGNAIVYKQDGFWYIGLV